MNIIRTEETRILTGGATTLIELTDDLYDLAELIVKERPFQIKDRLRNAISNIDECIENLDTAIEEAIDEALKPPVDWEVFSKE